MEPDSLNEYFKREYDRMSKEYLNSPLPFLREIKGTFIMPPWHKRIRNRLKNKVWDVRIYFANKLAGFDVIDTDWD